MTESFIHYTWQFQYFDKRNLLTTSGEPVEILHTGFFNKNAGPDFSQAKVKIESINWVGAVEIHIHSSDWNNHHHQHDDAYENVILHVVWKNDKNIFRKDGSIIPTIELQHRVDASLLLRYKNLVNHPNIIPCANSLQQVKPIIKITALEKATTQRLQRKAYTILERLKANNHDWEETLYQLLGRNFGFNINSDAFEILTKNIPHKIILKHADKLHQIEALLLGTAGFLEDSADDYIILLQKEFKLLATKYSLAQNLIKKYQWKFLRLRPANFPTIRIAQFAALYCQSGKLFSTCIEANALQTIKDAFRVQQSVYWQNHYRPGVKSKRPVGFLGNAAIDTLIINSIVPLLAAYSIYKDESSFMEKATDFLNQLDAEKNSIIKTWTELQWKADSAFDSQGLLELQKEFCSKRLCLDCNIGHALIRPQ